ncbi:S24/S26 family peptidase [Carboxylicivirga marina]|uniref:S24/S26 family peptidase n=1 Tax=Carboxylicivirga marina TaxID=2800988 RepID=A0ABS1HE99_9BACT|nr:S24/S26 family peptidase [Carboxylicivirga marina]MBK3515820.1 S24/S26 family peptidase [Carboxylicivirga marina]
MKLAKHNIQKALIELLKDGQQVEVPAHGMSMFPLLKPGDSLLVKPCLPNIGDISVFIKGELLIAHRLIKITGNTYFFKGDGLIFPDKPVEKQDVLGVVTQRKRGKNIRSTNGYTYRLFKFLMPKLTFLTGRFFYYAGRVYGRFFKIKSTT